MPEFGLPHTPRSSAASFHEFELPSCLSLRIYRSPQAQQVGRRYPLQDIRRPRTVLDLEAVAPDGIVEETVENQCLENAASRRTTAYHCTADLLVTQLEDLLLCIWKCAIMNSAGDVSNDAGDGMADCAHLGLAPLDVHLRIFWRTTSNPL